MPLTSPMPSLCQNRLRRAACRLAGMLALASLTGTAALADTPSVKVITLSALDFGSFVVPSSGSRTVTPSGMTSDLGLFPIDGSPAAPAQFTIAYDRGNESKQALDIEFQVVISAPATTVKDGVSANLVALQTDLPGYANLTSGQVVTLTITGCRERVCSRSFQVGGRLEVVRNFGEAWLELPVPIDVYVIATR